MSGETVLVVAAHPDDEALGCGGTIARHIAAGDAVHVLFVADGVRGRGEGRDAIAQRRANCHHALALLGVKEPSFLDLVDQKLDATPLYDVTTAIENATRDLRPDVVYTHHAGDLNADHRVVSQAVLTAFRPLPGAAGRCIYGFEVASSTEWAFGSTGEDFRPARFVDISATFDAKMAALRAYDGEMRNFPHARSYKAVEALAVWRGATVGVPYAEAFTVFREVIS
jgi:N-acetylglucosamine malate deacetylase 1